MPLQTVATMDCHISLYLLSLAIILHTFTSISPLFQERGINTLIPFFWRLNMDFPGTGTTVDPFVLFLLPLAASLLHKKKKIYCSYYSIHILLPLSSSCSHLLSRFPVRTVSVVSTAMIGGEGQVWLVVI